MTEQETKQIIVVLSTGRSGTSLLMKALRSMGMRLSEDMMSGNYANPEGHFEDKDIVNIHRNLFHRLAAHPYLPLFDGWTSMPVTNKVKEELQDVLKRRTTPSSGLWGFKDPRISSLLPLWFRVFNTEKAVPIFILAVRNPGSTVASFIKQYDDEPSMVELAYLTRITDSLHYTAGDCFIVHYEDWFTRPVELAQGLLTYTGLDQYFTGNVEDTIKDVVKPNLNRAVYEDYEIQNEYVVRLYDVLKECRGDEFDRAKLMAVVKQCRKAMEGFKGWYLEAQKHITQEADIRGRLTRAREHESEVKAKLDKERERVQELKGKLDNECKRVEELEAARNAETHWEAERKKFEADLEAMVLENNQLLKASKDYFEQAEEYRKQVVFLREQNKDQGANVSAERNAGNKGDQKSPVKQFQEQPSNDQIKKLQQEIIKLRHRYSFRLGKILTDAVLRPGRNTLLMPYSLAILTWDIVTGRGRKKMERAVAGRRL